jgi:hypothetical protein
MKKKVLGLTILAPAQSEAAKRYWRQLVARDSGSYLQMQLEQVDHRCWEGLFDHLGSQKLMSPMEQRVLGRPVLVTFYITTCIVCKIRRGEGIWVRKVSNGIHVRLLLAALESSE